MELGNLPDWIDEHSGVDFVWYIKRLSANDTLANKTHQAGPYIPRGILFELFPDLENPYELNPRVSFDLAIDSHSENRSVTAIWYNNSIAAAGTRNEARVTGFGGARSALLDPESTGSIAVFAFSLDEQQHARSCSVWVCRSYPEEDLLEDRLGPIEPGVGRLHRFGGTDSMELLNEQKRKPNCGLSPDEIPSEWLERFPSGMELVLKTLELRPLRPNVKSNADDRLVRRRDCEYELFRSIEEVLEMRRIQSGFRHISEFLDCAQTILQRRKSRAGRSLELHTKAIFVEENLIEGADFTYQPTTEGKQKPDFIFPSANLYHNPSYPADKLRMLATKTTCKDRWRQILNEADRVRRKHLLTLQEGVSEAQFEEMDKANVQLVVPRSLLPKYPGSIQSKIITVEKFLDEIRSLK